MPAVTTTLDAREAAVPRLSPPDRSDHLDILESREMSFPRAGAAVLERPLPGHHRRPRTTRVDAFADHGFDACAGGARRDEDERRDKE